MDKEIKIFQNESFGAVRALTINGQPFFVGKDVAEILGYTNPQKAIRDHVDSEDIRGERIVHPLGGEQETKLINESGLYSLILSSKLPGARIFKRWVTAEVLPAIRQDGGYMTTRLNETPEQIMARALKIADRTLERQREQLDRLRAENEVLEPLAAFAKSVSSSEDTILVRELAKQLSQNGIPIGGNRLFEWLRNHGYLINSRTSDRNSPTQRAMEMGLFEVSTTTISTADGKTRVRHTPKVTGKGQQYFFEKFTELKEYEENYVG